MPLTRAWCIFEVDFIHYNYSYRVTYIYIIILFLQLYACELTKSHFHVAMTPQETDRFSLMLQQDPSVFYALIGNVSCKNSQSFKSTDKELIFQAIESTVGFTQLHSMIFRVLER
jgi:hypothetical protein